MTHSETTQLPYGKHRTFTNRSKKTNTADTHTNTTTSAAALLRRRGHALRRAGATRVDHSTFAAHLSSHRAGSRRSRLALRDPHHFYQHQTAVSTIAKPLSSTTYLVADIARVDHQPSRWRPTRRSSTTCSRNLSRRTGMCNGDVVSGSSSWAETTRSSVYKKNQQAKPTPSSRSGRSALAKLSPSSLRTSVTLQW